MSKAVISDSCTYAHEHNDAFIEQYKDLLRFPTIGADPAHKQDVLDTCDWIIAEMQRIGMKNCQRLPTAGNPAAYGEWLDAGEDKPTLLVYAHYDVQPVDPLDLWVSPPFEPTIREGKLYARGVIDDKIGVFIHLKAVESMLETSGTLPVNIKFLFEGEEEIGSPTMEPMIREYADLLKSDLAVISDGGGSQGTPIMMISIRGIIAGEVHVSGSKRDLHSGSFGGVVHNPIHKVGEIIGALHDAEGRIQIPGFYDDVETLSDEKRATMEMYADIITQRTKEVTGLDTLWGIPEYTYMERSTAQPTCDVNGVTGGYQGAGTKTVLPAEASFKVSMRLVANQNPTDIAEKFLAFIDSFQCDTLKISAKVTAKAYPAELLAEEAPAQAASKAYEAGWGKAPVMERGGGSVPIVGMLQHVLDVPVVSLGLGNGGGGHAPNEYLVLEYFEKSLVTAINFFYLMAEA